MPRLIRIKVGLTSSLADYLHIPIIVIRNPLVKLVIRHSGYSRSIATIKDPPMTEPKVCFPRQGILAFIDGNRAERSLNNPSTREAMKTYTIPLIYELFCKILDNKDIISESKYLFPLDMVL